MFPKQVDLKALHRAFDVDADCHVSYNEFIRSLCEPKLSARKQELVDKAWAAVPEPKDAAALKGALKDQDHEIAGSDVSYDAFVEYWRGVSTIVPNDEYFAQVVEKTFGVKEEIDADVQRDRVMQVISYIRQRLLTLSNSSQEEYVLQNIFRTFDLDKSGGISESELRGMLSKLGVTVQDKEVAAILRMLDTNGSGKIEVDEFMNFIIVDPYKRY